MSFSRFHISHPLKWGHRLDWDGVSCVGGATDCQVEVNMANQIRWFEHRGEVCNDEALVRGYGTKKLV